MFFGRNLLNLNKLVLFWMQIIDPVIITSLHDHSLSLFGWNRIESIIYALFWIFVDFLWFLCWKETWQHLTASSAAPCLHPAICSGSILWCCDYYCYFRDPFDTICLNFRSPRSPSFARFAFARPHFPLAKLRSFFWLPAILPGWTLFSRSRSCCCLFRRLILKVGYRCCHPSWWNRWRSPTLRLLGFNYCYLSLLYHLRKKSARGMAHPWIGCLISIPLPELVESSWPVQGCSWQVSD